MAVSAHLVDRASSAAMSIWPIASNAVRKEEAKLHRFNNERRRAYLWRTEILKIAPDIWLKMCATLKCCCIRRSWCTSVSSGTEDARDAVSKVYYRYLPMGVGWLMFSCQTLARDTLLESQVV